MNLRKLSEKLPIGISFKFLYKFEKFTNFSLFYIMTK